MKLLELYTSVQGEGPRTGQPIQFVRFAGCNMRCPGWPCDTPQAIFPERYTDAYEGVKPADVIDKLDRYPQAICITGGEPFMQKGINELIGRAVDNLYEVDIFTNGSFDFTPAIYNPRVSVIMDWKLEGSGEADTKIQTRRSNITRLARKDAVKFVVKDAHDLMEARSHYDQLKKYTGAQFWVGAAWGHIADADIVDFVLKHELPWHLNVQQHKYVWDPEEVLR